MAPSLPELPGVQHRFLELSTGVRVHVAEAGDPAAPPVLCLHGWPQHWWIWRRVIPLMSDDFRLLCPDLRGFGWSDPPADGDFRKQRLADDAIALLDALEIERAHLMGHDWGAWTGLLLAIGAPERLHSLLALGILHPWQPAGRALRNSWRFAYQVPLATPVLGDRLQRRDAFVRRVLRLAWGDRDTWDEAAARSYAEVLAEPGRGDAGHRMYRTVLTRELGPGLAGRYRGRRLGVPTRLLVGRRDPLGPALAMGIERHGDDAATEVLEGCGHFVPEERPDIVAERARTLFRRASRASR
jgi:pimeloyl-ACP methyl ester carboxylesterase